MQIRSLTSSDKYFLLLAIAPVWWLIADILFYRLGGDEALPAANVATVFVMVVLVLLDSRALAKLGVRVSPWWGVLLIPPYLVVRTRRAQSTWALPITWLILVVVYLIAYAPILTATGRPS